MNPFRAGRALVCAGMFAVVCMAAATPPKLRLSEVQDLAPTGYRVSLSLDPAAESFQGTVDIRVKVGKPADTIWLNANKLKIDEAAFIAGGKSWPATAVDGGEDFLGLRFTSAVPAGAGEIHIRYTGVLRPDSSGVFRVEDQGNRYILTQFESTDARDAFPCFDEPGYKTPWQLTLRVPAGNAAVSNTPVESERTEGGARVIVFRETKPLPSYLVAFGVGPFDFVEAGTAGRKRVPVRIVTPKGRAGEAKYAAEVTATILTRLEDYFGIPYPYEKSDQVAVPVTTGFGAMENAGMVTYGANIVLAKPETDTITRQRGYASVAAHELAHQWFGDLVTTEWWNDIWLNEAFATWMEQKLIAEWKPEWKTRMDDVDENLYAMGQDSLATARRIRQPIESKGDIGSAFDGITYQKGAAVIGMFESWMGAEAFRKGVQGYLRQYEFRNATAPDFLNALAAASGRKEIAAAFSTFLNQPGVPLLSVALDCAGKAPALRLAQQRSLPLGSKGSATGVWQVPVCVRYGTGATGRSECTLMTQASMTWALPGGGSCPAWVQANDRAKGYYRVDYQGGLAGGLAGADAARRLDAPERVDLIGNAAALAAAGKLPAAESLRLAETFHADPERDVVERALNVALAPHSDLVPDELVPNYQRFLQKNFGARARELGWSPKSGETDDVRLLRPPLVSAMAMYGGDGALAKEAGTLAQRWLTDRSAVSPDVTSAVLNTAAYYGDLELFRRYLAEFRKTQNRQEKQWLLSALSSFRDRAAIAAGMQAVLSGEVKLVDGYPLLVNSGQAYAPTRSMAFDFVRAHFDQIMKDDPSIFGFPLGSFLPSRVGASFCDARSRDELRTFFAPRVEKYAGAPRALAQTVESIDLCIAAKSAQAESVAGFLRNY
jgi:alanyl aminopeptidase